MNKRQAKKAMLTIRPYKYRHSQHVTATEVNAYNEGIMRQFSGVFRLYSEILRKELLKVSKELTDD